MVDNEVDERLENERIVHGRHLHVLHAVPARFSASQLGVV